MRFVLSYLDLYMINNWHCHTNMAAWVVDDSDKHALCQSIFRVSCFVGLCSGLGFFLSFFQFKMERSIGFHESFIVLLKFAKYLFLS